MSKTIKQKRDVPLTLKDNFIDSCDSKRLIREPRDDEVVVMLRGGRYYIFEMNSYLGQIIMATCHMMEDMDD